MTIHNDYVALCRFRQQLEETSKNLRDQLRKTEAAIETVAQGWKDVQFEQFKNGFEEDKEIIDPLCKEIDDFNNVLLQPLQGTIKRYLELEN